MLILLATHMIDHETLCSLSKVVPRWTVLGHEEVVTSAKAMNSYGARIRG